MADWNEGYVTDVEYTRGYYTELNPVRTGFALAYAGVQPPKIANACELGFGQGVSIALHAAAQNRDWWGTDFNPTHTAYARGLSTSPSAARNLTDESFSQFCSREDLPDFDFIGLHGIWTWVSAENQQILVDFIRRKLNVGGVLYISYNTYPGWSDLAPLRHLIKRHVEVNGSREKDLFSRIGNSIAFVEDLAKANPFFMQAAPRTKDRLKSLGEHNKHYIAHEYLTSDWNTVYFDQFAKLMGPAKVSYVASAFLLDAVDELNLTKDQQQKLSQIQDPEFRESVRDFCVNQQFRRDIWVKGPEKLGPPERAAEFRKQRVILGVHRNSVVLKVRGVLGEATLNQTVYGPILDYLQDHAIRSVGDIETIGLAANISSAQVFSAVNILAGIGALQIAQPDEAIEATRESCEKINLELISRAAKGAAVDYLASPVCGGGIAVGRIHQLFIGAIKDGAHDAPAQASHVWEKLSAIGQKLLKDGKSLDTKEENLAELEELAKNFAGDQLPGLRALGLV